jgi:hypothetical protein
MVKRTSRYGASEPFIATALSRFTGLMPREITAAEGVLEYRVVAGDRPDVLGQRFFNDDRMWWRIADANVGFLFGQDMTHPSSPSDAPDELGREGMAGVPVLIPKRE